jgi:hypothetical protein
VHRRPGVRRRVLDLITVSCMEMLHRRLRLSVAIERVKDQGAGLYGATCCLAQFHAAMHNTQAGVRALQTAFARGRPQGPQPKLSIGPQPMAREEVPLPSEK